MATLPVWRTGWSSEDEWGTLATRGVPVSSWPGPSPPEDALQGLTASLHETPPGGSYLTQSLQGRAEREDAESK